MRMNFGKILAVASVLLLVALLALGAIVVVHNSLAESRELAACEEQHPGKLYVCASKFRSEAAAFDACRGQFDATYCRRRFPDVPSRHEREEGELDEDLNTANNAANSMLTY